MTEYDPLNHFSPAVYQRFITTNRPERSAGEHRVPVPQHQISAGHSVQHQKQHSPHSWHPSLLARQSAQRREGLFWAHSSTGTITWPCDVTWSDDVIMWWVAWSCLAARGKRGQPVRRGTLKIPVIRLDLMISLCKQNSQQMIRVSSGRLSCYLSDASSLLPSASKLGVCHVINKTKRFG